MENENVNENKELKVELYDANKQIQGLSNTLGNIGGLMGLQGEELTIDNIMQKLNDLVNEQNEKSPDCNSLGFFYIYAKRTSLQCFSALSSVDKPS